MKKTWEDYAANLEWHYNPQVATPEARDPAEALRASLSEEARRTLAVQGDIRYGPAERQVLDFFPAGNDAPAIHIYLHGGFWRRGDKSASSHVAVPAVRRGIPTVVMNYGLCPAVTLETATQQVIDGIAWVYRNAFELGARERRIFLSGHSAGAHLSAMALAYDWSKTGITEQFICGAALVSGIFDLEPVLHVSVNEQIRLTPGRVGANSPIEHPPRAAVPLLFAVGGREAAGWIAQTEYYAAVCRAAGCPVLSISFPEDNHYSITVAAHGRDDSPLVAAIAELICGKLVLTSDPSPPSD